MTSVMNDPSGSGTSDDSGYSRPTGPRQLRRSSSNRVVSGVAGGIGEYFGLDPVLFRIIFATTAFFGGSGLIAYLIGWLAIPSEGSSDTGLDRVVHELRRRQVPVWAVFVVFGLAAWAGLFSWWYPIGFVPALIVAAIIYAAYRFRDRPLRRPRPTAGTLTTTDADPTPSSTESMAFGEASTVSLEKNAAAANTPQNSAETVPDSALPPTWIRDGREWVAEARAAGRARRRRSAPVRWATLLVLVITMGVLVLSDRVRGIVIPAYFWTAAAIVAVGLLVGLVTRRTPWSLLGFFPFLLAGLAAFGGTHASLHDGIGDQTYSPRSYAQLSGEYRLAIGRLRLDLTQLPISDEPRFVDITLAAGQIVIDAPADANVLVDATVHSGSIEERTGTDASRSDDEFADGNDGQVGGYNVSRTIEPTTTATTPLVTIRVHVAAGDITVNH